MIQNIEFNPLKDKNEVIPGLAPVIQEILDTGVVPISAVNPIYNEIDDIDSIGERVEDSFQAMDALANIEMSNTDSANS